MVPHFTVLIFALIGAFSNGISGFIIWGSCSLLGVFIFGWIIGRVNGGLVPRKVRNETATDFIENFPELIMDTYPDLSPFQAKELFVSMLEDMFKRALYIDTSVKAYPKPYIFFLAADEIAEEQPTEPKKKTAKIFINFLKTHKHWKIQ